MTINEKHFVLDRIGNSISELNAALNKIIFLPDSARERQLIRLAISALKDMQTTIEAANPSFIDDYI